MEVVLALDDYNDIFDDFDIRPYKERAISVDFREELQRRISKLGCEERIGIVLTLPRYKRIRTDEKIIARRLRAYFEDRYVMYSARKHKSWAKTALFIMLGLACLAASFYISSISELLSEYLIIGVYFFTWQGLDEFIYSYPKISRRVERYRCMKEAHIRFSNEENYEG
ncbi:MAG: hypothetical protein QW035_01130 [Candidatus Anstonellales archaeon]